LRHIVEPGVVQNREDDLLLYPGLVCVILHRDRAAASTVCLRPSVLHLAREKRQKRISCPIGCHQISSSCLRVHRPACIIYPVLDPPHDIVNQLTLRRDDRRYVGIMHMGPAALEISGWFVDDDVVYCVVDAPADCLWSGQRLMAFLKPACSKALPQFIDPLIR